MIQVKIIAVHVAKAGAIVVVAKILPSASPSAAAALNAESANSFQSIYSNIEQTIASNRISISGVDADEEAASMINYQNAYNLSSKMISVLCEVYDKLIQETGV